MAELNVETLIDLQRLQHVQDSFAEATELAMIAVDSRGTPVTSSSMFTEFCQQMRADPLRRRLCYGCDAHGGLQAAIEGRPAIYRCHAGLVDFSVPLMVGGTYVGAILCGQVRLTDHAADPDYLTVRDESWSDDRKLVPLFREIPAVSLRKVRAAAETLYELGRDVTDEFPIRRTPAAPDLAADPPVGRRLLTLVDLAAARAESTALVMEALTGGDLTAAVDAAERVIDAAYDTGSAHRRMDQLTRLEDQIVEFAQEGCPAEAGHLQELVLRQRSRAGWGQNRYAYQLHFESLLFAVSDGMARARPRRRRTLLDLRNHLAHNPARAISLHEAAGFLNVSPSHLSKRFKAETGSNYVAYVTTRRIERAKMMLACTEMAILEIAVELGFNQVNYFSRVFKAYTGISPSEFRRVFPLGPNGGFHRATLPGRDDDLLRA